MKNSLKKLAASLLAAMMVFTFMPSMAYVTFADDSVNAAEDTIKYSSVVVTGNYSIPDQIYTGRMPDLSDVAALATVTATVDGSEGVVLTRDVDYTVEAATAGETDSAGVVFEGLGAFEEAEFTNSITFKIVAVPAEAELTVSSFDESGFVYGCNDVDAGAVKAAAKVLRNGKSKVTEYFVDVEPDADNEYEGSGENGKPKAGNKYTVSFKATAESETAFDVREIEIAPKDLAECELTGTVDGGLTYNGKEQKPAAFVTVRSDEDNSVFPMKGFELTGAYANNVNASTEESMAVAYFKPVDTNTNYTGTGSIKFSIAKFDLAYAAVEFTPVDDLVYNGENQNPELDVKAYFGNGRNDKQIEDEFEVRYFRESRRAGSYNAQIVAPREGNLTGGKRLVDSTDDTHYAYKINPVSLKDAVVTLKEDVEIESGESIDRTNYYDYFNITTTTGYTLRERDYDVTVNQNPENGIGKAGDEVTVTITGDSNSNFVSGEENAATTKYTIAASALEDVYKSEVDSIVYDGNPKTPKSDTLGSVYGFDEDGNVDSSKELTKDDYNVPAGAVYENNVNAGTATVEIEGRGTYRGSSVVEFTILQKEIDLAGYTASFETNAIKDGAYYEGVEVPVTGKVTLSKEGSPSYEFDADEVVVTADTISQGRLTGVKVTVAEDGNYDCGESFATGAVNVGADEVDLDSIGELEEESVFAFETTTDIADAVTVKAGDTVIGKNAYDASVSIKDEDGDPVSGRNYVIVGDTVTVTVAAKTGDAAVEGVKGEFAATLSVDARPLDDNSVTLGLTANGYTYDGTQKTPGVVVKDKGSNGTASTLIKDTDYTVEYGENVNAGIDAGTVTVTGTGNYSGTIVKTFEIKKANLAYLYIDEDITLDQPAVEFFVGAPEDISSSLSLKADEESALEISDADYSIAISEERPIYYNGRGYEEIDAEFAYDQTFVEYMVTANEDSTNYERASFEVHCVLSKKQVKNAVVTIENPQQEYVEGATVAGNTCDYKLGEITVSVDGNTLVSRRDYDLSYSGTNAVGETPTVTVTFKGNYAGAALKNYAIVDGKLDFENVTLESPADLVYDADEKEVTVDYIGDGEWFETGDNADNSKYFTVVYYDEEGNPVTKPAVGDNPQIPAAPTEVGKYVAKVTADANYGGGTYAEEEFEITTRELSKTEFNYLVEGKFIDGYEVGDPITAAGTYPDAPTLSGAFEDEFEIESFDEFEGKSAEKTYKAVIKLKEGSSITAPTLLGNDRTAKVDLTWSRGPIDEIDLSEVFTIADMPYTGKAVEPTVENMLAAEGYEDLLNYVTFDYFENNVSKSKKSAKAHITVDATDSDFFCGDTGGFILFGIITDEEAAAAADEALAAAEGIDSTYPADAQKAVKDAADALKDALEQGTTSDVTKATAALNDAVLAAEKAKANAAVADANKITAAQYKADSVNAVAAAKKAVTDAIASGDVAAIKAATAKLSDAVKAAQKKDASKFAAKKAKKTLKAKKSRKTKISAKKAFKVSGVAGKVTYKKVKVNKKKYNKKFSVSAAGKVTVKKGVKKGTYKLTVAVTDSGNGNVMGATKNVVLKIKVK